jgi:hypothetical protein
MTKTDYVVDFASLGGFDKLTFDAAQFGGAASVTFDELGAPDNSGYVIVRSGGSAYRLDVAAATGNVTVTPQ